jgi:hypothetical protein
MKHLRQYNEQFNVRTFAFETEPPAAELPIPELKDNEQIPTEPAV